MSIFGAASNLCTNDDLGMCRDLRWHFLASSQNLSLLGCRCYRMHQQHDRGQISSHVGNWLGRLQTSRPARCASRQVVRASGDDWYGPDRPKFLVSLTC